MALVSSPRKFLHDIIILSSVLAIQFDWSPALAVIRKTITYTTFINPMALSGAVAYFGTTGLHLIAGGVVLDGRAQFSLESGVGITSPVSPQDVRLILDSFRRVALSVGGVAYALELPDGLACPLGQFIERGGLIAFTVPEDASTAGQRRLQSLGVVDGTIAREFLGTKFARLVEQADFADTVEIPDALKAQIISGINSKIGLTRGLPVNDGSYINSDFQVTYTVYLVASSHRVDVAGVPLRYYWDYARDGSAIVTDVEAFAQNWPDGQALTSNKYASSEFTQYDVVNFYQTAAVFRQISRSDRNGFSRFVSDVCAK